jgi:TolA-binding protein
MNPKVKLAAYAVLLILAAWFGLAFRSNYAEVTATANSDAGEPAPVVATPPPSTNASTNVTGQTTNAAGEPTNPATEVTNTTAAVTNPAPAEPAPRLQPRKAAPKPVPVDVAAAKGAMIGYLAGLIAVIIGLGLLIATDVTHFIGGKATDYLFTDIGDAMRDPLYERAEAEWANGSFLEAVESLREYLKHNPREIHAALRIAEIYEKDLNNPLAAALEYEEVLQQKLLPEKWGWSAIHLCNLYSKLNHHDKTRDLLQRIVDEYPKTGAAKKARTRLGLAELEDETPASDSVESVKTSKTTTAPTAQDSQEEPEAPPPPEPPKPSLPPGFRPKK